MAKKLASRIYTIMDDKIVERRGGPIRICRNSTPPVLEIVLDYDKKTDNGIYLEVPIDALLRALKQEGFLVTS